MPKLFGWSVIAQAIPGKLFQANAIIRGLCGRISEWSLFSCDDRQESLLHDPGAFCSVSIINALVCIEQPLQTVSRPVK
jgi:hypothetical protein